jgi:hypothetical protein
VLIFIGSALLVLLERSTLCIVCIACTDFHCVLVVLLQGFQGGGLAIIQAAAASLYNVTIIDNTASLAGGGAALLQVRSVEWSSSVLQRNAAQLGGGLVAGGSSLQLHGVKFTKNSAASGAAGAGTDGQVGFGQRMSTFNECHAAGNCLQNCSNHNNTATSAL